MKHRKTKRQVQKIHASNRAAVRYGISLSSRMYNDAISQVTSENSGFVMHITRTRSLHMVTIAGRQVPVVYDRVRKSIATVLPMPYCLFGRV